MATRTIYVCDCCGKEAPATSEPTAGYELAGGDGPFPRGWFAVHISPRAGLRAGTFSEGKVLCDTCDVVIKKATNLSAVR